MRVFLEGKVIGVDVTDAPGKKDPSKTWRNITYQVLSDVKGRKFELENITVIGTPEETPVNPLMESARKSGSRVRIMINTKAELRNGKAEQVSRILEIEPAFESPPAKETGNGAGKQETVAAGVAR